ncbi:hypothetical protein SAMN05421647_101146 [Marinobacterium stanieri]|uniref:Uncharacterized protein n=1 Tax=Marinobacterium stanieri TaxID=49186 RepID=A0A1N6N965_9GAMM|nr:hypothetical protein SAMN05421647_101146 [Marinobacterium stanieri]
MPSTSAYIKYAFLMSHTAQSIRLLGRYFYQTCLKEEKCHIHNLD